MKTVVYYMITATLINAAWILDDIGLLLFGLAAAYGSWRHSKTLTLKPMQTDNTREF